MTLTDLTRPSAPAAAPAPSGRSDLDLAARQLQAIAAFHRARHVAEEAAAAATRSREMRMDAARRLEVVRREHEALIARSHEQLRLTGTVLRGAAERRVVLAHRNEWFLDKITQVLGAHGLHVVARLDNGADAVGVAVAEQPDLLLVEDSLAMVGGEQVVREVRTFSPQTLVAAQVAYGDRVGPFLDAGASTVFTRKVPPADVERGLLELLAG